MSCASGIGPFVPATAPPVRSSRAMEEKGSVRPPEDDGIIRSSLPDRFAGSRVRWSYRRPARRAVQDHVEGGRPGRLCAIPHRDGSVLLEIEVVDDGRDLGNVEEVDAAVVGVGTERLAAAR